MNKVWCQRALFDVGFEFYLAWTFQIQDSYTYELGGGGVPMSTCNMLSVDR